jgi:hypothetical protein
MIRTKIATMLALLGLACSTICGQAFEESLKSAFAKFDGASSLQAMLAASSQIDIIALKNPNQWASNFYTAYAHIKISFALTDKNQRDQYLDAADKSLIKAEKLASKDQEVFILRAWYAKARIAVDPTERWKKFGDVYDDAIARAKHLSAENPRIYFLEGNGPFFKPKIWGGGKDKAKPYFLKARELFTREDKSDILKPFWGEKANEDFLKQCDQ